MEYQALYRKYRPQRFDEVVGQDHVTRTLAREVVDGKVAHAYLFAGPRGTGKTTSARLLAKALNCTNRHPDGEPCNECHSCIGITEGTSLDVIELDAASHNKVEDIREIRVNVGTVAAAGGARRIYILDEAHMLSRAAGNALLKTLEEPPEHVVFVLATTEPYKLLDTIRSRSQRFDFHPVTSEKLVDYLELIAKREGFNPQPDGLEMVAAHARGSVRDAMSLLEQVAALGRGKVEAPTVARALGLADKEAFGLLAKAITEEDAPGALGLVASLASQGADLRRFVGDAIEFFRGLFLAQYAPNLEEVADETSDTLDEWRRYATMIPPADVLRVVDHLAEALVQLRQGREERIVVELALLRLTRPETSIDASSLGARLQRVEERIRNLSVAPMAVPPEPSATAPSRPAQSEPDSAPGRERAGAPVTEEPVRAAPQPPVDAPDAPFETAAPARAIEVTPPPLRQTRPAIEVTLEQVEAVWPALVARVREEAGPRRHALLKEASPAAVEKGAVVFELPDHLSFHLEQLQQDAELNDRVQALATEMLGGAIDVVFRSDAGGRRPGAAKPQGDDDPASAPDKDQLLEEGSDDTDPAGLIVDLLGGEIVSE